MRALSACQSAMVGVVRTVKPMGPAYHAASMVVSAIDGFAAFLTGERYFFSTDGSSPTAPQRDGSGPVGEETFKTGGLRQSGFKLPALLSSRREAA